jgi:isoquinoline 1-oxidoreductase alpha subunit
LPDPDQELNRHLEESEMALVKINGQSVKIDGPDDMPLLWALRDLLGMTGTKFGCGVAMCGACTVLIDGNPTRSCITPLAAIAGKSVTTIEGAAATLEGAAIQKAWLAIEVPQCGYCQSGQIMSACALLKANPKPSDSDIDKVMSGNVCRCGTYERIRNGIKVAARSLAGSKQS